MDQRHVARGGCTMRSEQGTAVTSFCSDVHDRSAQMAWAAPETQHRRRGRHAGEPPGDSFQKKTITRSASELFAIVRVYANANELRCPDNTRPSRAGDASGDTGEKTTAHENEEQIEDKIDPFYNNAIRGAERHTVVPSSCKLCSRPLVRTAKPCMPPERNSNRYRRVPRPGASL